MASHLTAFCAWDGSLYFLVTPGQLMRPGTGQNMYYAEGEFVRRPAFIQRDVVRWFLMSAVIMWGRWTLLHWSYVITCNTACPLMQSTAIQLQTKLVIDMHTCTLTCMWEVSTGLGETQDHTINVLSSPANFSLVSQPVAWWLSVWWYLCL